MGRQKRKKYIKKPASRQAGEWFPLFVVQRGKYAPRLYDVILKEKPAKGKSFRSIDYSKMKMERLRGKHLITLLEEEEGRKRVYRNRHRIIDGLADFLVENIKLGVIHGQIGPEHILLKRRWKKLDVKKIYDFGIGKIADTEHGATKIEIRDPLGHARDYYDAAYVVEKVAESSGRKGRGLGKEKRKLLEYLKKKFEKRIEEVM